MNDIDRKERLAKLFKWGIVLGTAVIVAPFVYLAITGLVGLAVAIGVGLAINAFAPVLAKQLAIWKIQGLKGLARRNPIEMRETIALEQRSKLADFARSITAFSAEVKTFSDEIVGLRNQYPSDAAQFNEQLALCQAALRQQRDKYEAALAAADAFDEATKRARAKWKVAQSAMKMKVLAGQQMGSAMDKILAEESLDSVQSAMNLAFAELETSVMQATAPSLSYSPTAPAVFDATPVTRAEVLR